MKKMAEDNFAETKSPIRRLGSTRKLLAFNNIRYQLSEQIRCLDTRMEVQMAIVYEIQDFFKRKAEVELEYSKSLDKLVKNLQIRHKEQKQKREHWHIFSTNSCWKELLKQTANSSKDHLTISEIYSAHLTSSLNQVIEDSQRIYKRCREIGCEAHEDILRILQELHATMKTYQTYQNDCKQTETKLSTALYQQHKIEQSMSAEKLEKSKKYRAIVKEVQKRKNKYTDAKLKALKAKNEYCLCLEASNVNIKKYFLDDIPDLINFIDFGFHDCIKRALMMHVTSIYGKQNSEKSALESLLNCMNSINSFCDKRRFFENNLAAFMVPKKLEFQGQKIDNINEIEIKKILHQDMDVRLSQLQNRISSLQIEIEEIWKTLQTAEASIFEIIGEQDVNCAQYFGESAQPLPVQRRTGERVLSAAAAAATASDASACPASSSSSSSVHLESTVSLATKQQETEAFYLSKFQEFLTGTTRIARLEAKEEYIRQSLLELGADGAGPTGATTASGGSSAAINDKQTVVRRKKIGRSQLRSCNGQPKLFGGSLEDYLELTQQEIPLILKSCIRVINLYGLHHQGIFRVSGSQLEINNFREGFERGDDPLAEVTDASDINSVAGVMKLYLRELREPLFPIIYFERLMELAQIESKPVFVEKMRDLIKSLSKPVSVVMRYLFAFLNHLSEYCDENMMDTYNLAICFGPTLVPVPEDKDQVQYQNLVNDLIKCIIMFHDDIFPNDGGVVYEKYISQTYDDHDVVDFLSDNMHEDLEMDANQSEDDVDILEANVLFDFNARSDKEISLRKGQIVHLHSQVSNDWWRGSVDGRDGLIPDKYISLKIKDDEKDKLDSSQDNLENDNHLQYNCNSSRNDSLATESQLPLFSATNGETGERDLSAAYAARNSAPAATAVAALPPLPPQTSAAASATTATFHPPPARSAPAADTATATATTHVEKLNVYEKAASVPSPSPSNRTPDLVVDLPINFEKTASVASVASVAAVAAAAAAAASAAVLSPITTSVASTSQIPDTVVLAQSPTSSDSDSDNSEIITPADCFAKQKQNTLKKQAKNSPQIAKFFLNRDENELLSSPSPSPSPTAMTMAAPTSSSSPAAVSAQSTSATPKIKPALFKKPKLPQLKQPNLKFLKKSSS